MIKTALNISAVSRTAVYVSAVNTTKVYETAVYTTAECAAVYKIEGISLQC